MSTTSNALMSITDHHLLECFSLAVEMDLDLDFILQLSMEINQRKLSSQLNQINQPVRSYEAVVGAHI
ncbi:Sporulation inhibitor A [compost metagenome]